jgi:GT2 family glycosyltransferase
VLRDRRYFYLDGKPMLLIYRIGHIGDPSAAMRELRVALREEGIPEVHLAAGWVSFAPDGKLPADPAALGLDAYFEFPPHMLSCPLVQPLPIDLSERFTGLISDYNYAATGALAKLNDRIEGRRHRCVMAAWDNSARKGTDAHIFHGATPTSFRRWLRGTILHEGCQAGERVVFVNAWNEWAEGAYLEPDDDFGCGWLEAVASATGTAWSAAAGTSWDREHSQDRHVRAGDRSALDCEVGQCLNLCKGGNAEADQPQPPPYDKSYLNWVGLYDVLDAEDHRGIQKTIAAFPARPRFLLLLEGGNSGEAALSRTLDSITSQLYPDWQLSLTGTPSLAVGALVASAAATDPRIRLERLATESFQPDCFVARIGAGDVLAPHALYLLAATVIEGGDADLIYSDEDRLDEEGQRCAPHFKTDWSPELVVGGEPVGRLCAIRSDLVKSVDAPNIGDAADDYDWMLRLAERIAPAHVRHIPHVLYHRAVNSPEPSPVAVRKSVTRYLAAHGIAAEIFPAGRAGRFNRLCYPLPAPPPRVSLIVPTRDKVGLLCQCIDGLLDGTDYPNLQVLIVDNGSREPETLSYLASVTARPRVEVLTYDRPFNFSAINNFAVEWANGEFVGLVNNDIKVIRDDWLREMVAQAARPKVGAVGAKLYYENGAIQHAGLITGIHAIAGHVYRGSSRHDDGYFGRLHMVQEMSCVTGACMIIPRTVYRQVGGMDEVNLPVAYNDIDLCLRIRKLGYRVLWTPFAELAHLESASRGSDDLPEHRDRALREFNYMRGRWGDELDRDPFYNPNLTFETEDFGLAFPPRAVKPWRCGTFSL